VYDVSGKTPLRSKVIKTGAGAHAFRALGDKRHVLVSNRVLNSISKIDLKTMEVTERMMLGPHHALYMVRIGERQVVLGTSPSGCQLLLETSTNAAPGNGKRMAGL